MFQRILMGMGMLAAAEDIDIVANDTLYTVVQYINNILGALIGVAVAIAIVYAIVVGARMARANNAEEREEAKKKVVYTVVGIAVAVALMLVLFILRDKIPAWMGLIKIQKGDEIRWVQELTDAMHKAGWEKVSALIGL